MDGRGKVALGYLHVFSAAQEKAHGLQFTHTPDLKGETVRKETDSLKHYFTPQALQLSSPLLLTLLLHLFCPFISYSLIFQESYCLLHR